MKRHIIYIVLLFALLFVPKGATASMQSFRNVAVGGAATVLCVAQDGRGLIWMGTEAGLYSYDGYRTFAHFTVGQRENSRVHSMLVMGNRLCLGSDNGLLIYDIRTGDYEPVPQCPARNIRALVGDSTRLLLGGSDGLTVLPLDDRDEARQQHIPLPNVYSLLQTGIDDCLVGTIGGLYRCRGGKTVQLRIGEGKQPLVNALAAIDDRHPALGCWVGTEGALYRYRQGRFERVASMDGNSIKSIAKQGQSLSVGTDDGLYVLSPDGRVERYTHDSRLNGSIANNIVWAVAQFPGGIFCAGTDNGLSLSSANKAHRTVHLSEITGSGDGNTIHAMLHEPDGTMWLGGTNGLIRCHVEATADGIRASRVAWYRPGDSQCFLPHNRVRKIYRDREGDLVVCTDHGINVYDRQAQRFRNFILTDKSGHYTSAWAYDVVEDAQGRYWVAAYMGGVFVIDKQKLPGSGGRLLADRHLLGELQGPHVSQLAIDGQQRVWMRIFEGGIDVADGRTMKVAHRMTDTSGFLCADTNGGVVVAHGGRIERLAADGTSTASYALADAPGGTINAMTVADGCLWALVGRSCRVFRADGTSRQLAVPDGVAQSMLYDVALGQMVFGCNDALTLIRPEGVNAPNAAAPRLMLTGIEVNGQPWKADGVGASFAEAVRLDYDENNLRLCLSDLPYLSDLQQVYVYRLEGVDRAWQPLSGDDLSISYNALPHGRYRLTVCVSDGHGTPGREVYALDVTVRPPWYLTLWAKMLLLAVLVGLLLWAVNSYMVRERLRKERRERRQILAESEARTAFFDNLSGQLKSPVGRILSALYALLPDEKDSARRQRLNAARRDATRINELVVHSLDIEGRGSLAQGDGVEAVRIDMADFCRRTVDDLRPMADERKAELRFKTDTPIIYISLDLVRFSPLFRSLVAYAAANAVPQGMVTCALTADAEARTVAIRVTIGGWLLPKERLPFVFYRYGMASLTDTGKADEGINDLALLKDSVEQQGGTVSVSVEEETGTVFTLVLTGCEPLSGRAEGETSSTVGRSAPPSADTADSRLLAEITQVVEAHIADSELNVSRLQELVGLGDKLLYRRVKQMTGRTPVEFIRHIRMQRAAMLLREGKFTVSEVMYMVGFSNSSYFSKCFQKVYGITPAEYQRKARY